MKDDEIKYLVEVLNTMKKNDEEKKKKEEERKREERRERERREFRERIELFKITEYDVELALNESGISKDEITRKQIDAIVRISDANIEKIGKFIGVWKCGRYGDVRAVFENDAFVINSSGATVTDERPLLHCVTRPA